MCSAVKNWSVMHGLGLHTGPCCMQWGERGGAEGVMTSEALMCCAVCKSVNAVLGHHDPTNRSWNVQLMLQTHSSFCTGWLMHRLAGSSKTTGCQTFIGTMRWHNVDDVQQQWLAGCFAQLVSAKLAAATACCCYTAAT